MSDFFDNMNSQMNDGTQNSEVQMSCLMTGGETQSQANFHLRMNNSERKDDDNLEVIQEECSFPFLCSEQNNEANYKFPPSSNNKKTSTHQTLNNLTEKFVKLSQEVDEMIEETEKCASVNKNISNVSIVRATKNKVTNYGNPLNTVPNNFKGNSVQNSNFNYGVKNMQTKAVTLNNNFSINAPQSYNSTKTVINSYPYASNNPVINKTKQKLPTPNNKYQLYSNNNPNNASYEECINFVNTTDKMISGSVMMMEDVKREFCNFVDSFKDKFINNAEFIKQILVAETDYIINEEEKNRMIDEKMETLFREMMNILNEFQTIMHHN